jgi:hypothetical protein
VKRFRKDEGEGEVITAEKPLPLGHEFEVCNVPGCGICGKCQYHSSVPPFYRCGQPLAVHKAKP